MSTILSEIKLRIKAEGQAVFDGLSKKLNEIASQTTISTAKFRVLSGELKQQQNQTTQSIRTLRDYAASWRELANSVDITSQEFKQATAEAARLEAQIAKAQGRQGRGRVGAFAQIAGTIGSGAIFGGAEGALGAAIGGIKGGVPGAITGAALGATVGGLRQVITGTADYAAEVGRLRVALKGVSSNQKEFNDSIQFIQKSSQVYLTGLSDATRNYTKLQASVRGAGGTAKDTQIVFNGLSAAIIATGGKAEDINAAFTAASQVFSKGKVTAEELRGQIGERLAGAFTLFAQSLNKTPQQLDEALKKGEVKVSDFVTFCSTLFDKFGKSAEQIGKSPYAAGLRLELAFKNLQLAAGTALLPIISAFQELGIEVINNITRIIEGQTEWQQSLAQLAKQVLSNIGGIKGITNAISGLIKVLIVLAGATAGAFAVSNFSAFISGLRTIIKFTRELLTLEKIKLALAQAELGVRTLIAALSTGAGRAKILGLVAGGAGGLALIKILGSEIDKFTKTTIGNLEKALKGINFDQFGQFAKDQKNVLTGDGDAEENAKKRNDLFNKYLEQLNAQNDLLQAQGKLNQANASTEYERILVAKEAADEQLQKEQQILNLRLQFGKITKQAYDSGTQAIQTQTKTVTQESRNAIRKLTDEAQKLYDSFFGPGGKFSGEQESPLRKLEKEINREREQGIKTATEKGGAAFDQLRKKLDALTGADITGIATERLIGGDIDALKEQIALLGKSGQELTTLDRLKIKYLEDWENLDPKLRKILEDLAAQKDQLEENNKFADAFRNGIKSMGDLMSNLGQKFAEVFTGLGDQLAEFITTGKASFADFTRAVLADLAKIFVQAALFNTLKAIFPGGLSLGSFKFFAGGGVMTENGPMPLKRYAAGGVANSPQIAMFGEGSRPEAYVPLPDGRSIPVTMSGQGGGVNVVVNVDAKGSDVQGNGSQANALGVALSSAVKAEIIRQQRPGGLLAGTR
jgi:tape measure domain-containing protein